MRTATWTALLALSFIVRPSGSGRAADVLRDSPQEVGLAVDAAVDGTWVVDSQEMNGTPRRRKGLAPRLRFTFADGKLALNQGQNPVGGFSYKVRPRHHTGEIDLFSPGVSTPVSGIYEVKGQTLRICLRWEGTPAGRPTRFASLPNSGLEMIVLTKEKK